jgi:hypothetical protein
MPRKNGSCRCLELSLNFGEREVRKKVVSFLCLLLVGLGVGTRTVVSSNAKLGFGDYTGSDGETAAPFCGHGVNS